MFDNCNVRDGTDVLETKVIFITAVANWQGGDVAIEHKKLSVDVENRREVDCRCQGRGPAKREHAVQARH